MIHDKEKKGYIQRISCSTYNKKRLIEDCVELFIDKNPQFKGMNFTTNLILEKIIDFYIEENAFLRINLGFKKNGARRTD